MRTTIPLLLALAFVAGSAGAADTSSDTTSRAARRAEFQQRFLDQIDTNHDGVVSRAEYQAWVDARFAKLDTNGDGKLSFEEWTVRTRDTFAEADKDKNGALNRAEFASTKPKRSAKARCACGAAEKTGEVAE